MVYERDLFNPYPSNNLIRLLMKLANNNYSSIILKFKNFKASNSRLVPKETTLQVVFKKKPEILFFLFPDEICIFW